MAPEKDTTSNSEEDRVRVLEQEFRKEGVKNANSIIELLSCIQPKKSACVKAIHATRRTLKALEKPAEVEKTISEWLAIRRSDYASALQTVLDSKDASQEEIEAAVAAAALTHRSVWEAVLSNVIENGGEGRVAELALESFVARFGDLRLSALKLVKDRVGSLDTRLRVLSFCNSPIEAEHAREADAKFSQQSLRKAFGTAWLAVLEDKELSSKHRRIVLERIPTELIPNMSDPLALADFLNDSYNNGKDISVAISALDGLFVLISKHGLDYPLFYQKLYTLMSPYALFYAEGRTRFLELAAIFLKQGVNIPGGLVASFVKRLLRRAIIAPAESALWCIRLALDLLYRHPNVSYLVHRSVNLFDKSDAQQSHGGKRPRTEELDDPFDDDELDPQSSNADLSSLWELEVLSQHISPAVSRLVTAFSKDVRKNPAPPPGTLSDYADLSFEDTFHAEFKRKAKSSHLAYDQPGASPGVTQLGKKLDGCIGWV